MLRADLRSRLVSDAAARHRLDIGIPRSPARHIHGRPLHRQPLACPACQWTGIRCTCTPRSKPASASSRRWCSSRCPFLNRVYFAGAEHGLPGMLLRALLAGRLHAAPDDPDGRVSARHGALGRARPCRGAAFPGGAFSMAATPRVRCWLLVAGFCLLRVYNMATTTWVAVVYEPDIAAQPAASSGLSAPVAATDAARPPRPLPPSHWRTGRCTSTIALSGATALGAEVVWTRLIGMLLLATVYVFSVILAVF